MRLKRLIVRVVERRALAILIAVLLLSGLAVWSVSGIAIDTSQGAFLSTGSDAYRGYMEYEEAFGGDSMVILIPGSPLEFASATALQGFGELEAGLTADPRVRSVLSPFTLFSAATQQSELNLSSPTAALELALQDESLRAQLERFFPSNHVLVAVRLEGGLSIDDQSEAADFIEETVDASAFASDAIVAGNPSLVGDIKSSVVSGLAQTGAIAVVLMVVILFLAFPARWRLLSLPLVLVGALWTFGVAAVSGVPLTLVTLAGLPILIGLGVDFAIQFHNRYDEEMARGATPSRALMGTVEHIAPTVGIAVAVMILGFLTLLMSDVPGVQDFGVLLGIGAAVLYAVSLFVLNAFLYRFDRQPRSSLEDPAATDKSSGEKAKADTEKRPARKQFGPWLRRLLERDWLYLGQGLPAIARWSRRYSIWVLAFAVVLAALGIFADPKLPVETDIEKLIPSDIPGVVALNEARAVIGSSTELPLLIKTADVTAPDFLEWLAAFQDEVTRSRPDIVGADSLTSLLGLEPGDPAPSPEAVTAALDRLPVEMRENLVTADGMGASLTFSLSNMQTATMNELLDELVSSTDVPPGVVIVPGGLTTLSARTVDAFTAKRGLIAGIGIAAVLLGLLLIYGNWRRALIPVIPIALVTGWSSALMWAARVALNPLTAVLGALVIAVGTEFTVLLLSRYWEERAHGTPSDRAMDEAVTKVGRAITASGLTVAGGFGALIFSTFPALRDFGIVIVVDVIFALIVTVTVVPALVRWLDRDQASSPS